MKKIWFLGLMLWAGLLPRLEASTAAVGSLHTLVVDGSGHVWAWGDNSQGQLGLGSLNPSVIPVQVPGLSNVVAVAAGQFHSLALTSTGNLYAWGQNVYGQLGMGNNNGGSTSPVLVLTGVSKMAAGDNHSVALTTSGAVDTWGLNNNGQLGDGTVNSRNAPYQLPGISGYTGVGAGGQHTLAIDGSGSVWAWGRNDSGQLGTGDDTEHHTPTQVTGVSGITQVSGGEAFTLALRNDGVAWSWGSDVYGQLGDGQQSNSPSPVLVPDLQGVIAVAAGYYNSLAITSDGTVWGWGSNSLGEVGNGNTDVQLLPTPAGFGSIVSAASIGTGYSETSVVITSSGTVWAWGANANGQVGDGTNWDRLNPVKVMEAGYALKVGTPTFSLAVSPATYNTPQTLTLGSVTPGATIHYTTDGSIPTTSSTTYSSPIAINVSTTVKAIANKTGLQNSNVGPGVYTLQVATPAISPASGSYSTVQTVTISTTTPGATLYYTTDGTAPTTSSAQYTSPININITTTVQALGAKAGWSTGLTAFGNYTLLFGTLATPTASPAAGTTVGPVSVTLTAAAGATIHYTTDGSTPTASSATYSAPIPISVTTTLQAIAVEASWTSSSVFSGVYTIQANAPTFSPGAGTYSPGQAITLSCGAAGTTVYYTLDGTTPGASSQSLPCGSVVYVGTYTLKAAVGGTGLNLSAVTSANYSQNANPGGAVAGGTAFSLILKTDGTVWSFGDNAYGDLGDTTTTPRPQPVQVAGLTGVTVKAIAAGGYHALALDTAGNVWTWGYNVDGELGNGSSDYNAHSTPAKNGLTGIVAIASGGYHSLALDSSGNIWAWGSNTYGQLGVGDYNPRTSPTKVTALTSVAAIGAGAYHSLAATAAGAAYAWGVNNYGQVDSSYANKNTPLAISSLTSGVTFVSGGVLDSLARTSAGIVYSWGYSHGPTPGTVPGVTGSVMARAGTYNLLALEDDGGVWTWGYNNDGTFGTNGVPSSTTTPIQPIGLPAVVYIASGDNHVLAVGDDGSVWAWGLNGNSQLGDGTTTTAYVPIKVGEPSFQWKVGTPTFNVAAGTYNSSPTVTISTVTTGATIHYTLDGSIPTSSSPTYTAPLTISVTQTLSAIAIKTGLGNSNVASAAYTLQVATVSLSPSGTTYNTPQTVTLSTSTSGATIHYTLDGSTPTTSSPTYSSPVPVNVTSTLNAIGFINGWTPSPVATATYTLLVATPALSPGGGVFTTPQTVTVTTATPGATLHYTLTGLEPTEADPTVASGGTISVGQSATLKVAGFESGWVPSATAGATYVTNLGSVANPTFSPAAGTYTAAQNVILNSATPGAVIRYTLDGSSPTRWSPIFAAPIPVSATTTVTAQAFLPDNTPSAVASATFTINNGWVAAPTMSVASGFYPTSQTVTISDTTSGATIHYTTTGIDPTTGDPTISSGGTVNVSQGTILKANAMKSGMTNSAVTRRDYIIGGSIATAAAHTLILKSDGTVWAFGDNSYGDLGNGQTTASTTPVQATATGFSGVKAVAAGYYHSLALDSTGSVWAWGYNYYGQLGNGSFDTNNHPTPVKITGLPTIVAISAGQNHSLALDNHGLVWTFGFNGDGELGNGSADYNGHGSPQQISQTVLSGVVAISAGWTHNLALKNDTTVAAWGANGYGEIGNGNQNPQYSPTAVPNLSGVSTIVAGNASSYAIRAEGGSSGTVWAWGYNATGQLGDGTPSTRYTLVQGPSGILTLAAGDRHVVATRSDGTTVAWGANDYGQLGNGVTSSASMFQPVFTDAPAEMIQLGAGNSVSVALRADGTVSVWGNSYTNTPAAIAGFQAANNSGMLQDTDQDGLTNAAEYRLGTDPLNPDTNQDGIKDGAEVAMNLSPTNPDMDGDGLLNGYEIQIGTNPFNPDTDGDGHNDGVDCFPLDPTQWQCVSNPNDHTPPTITIDAPPNATPVP